ncbi:MAG: MOSC domain-containing protein [Anaerolineales bacterium]|nr:MOSC domain-containing protein [Anaerolineales bacterium]
MITLTGLFYYPIKSCRGHALEAAQLDERGLQHDRRFLIVNADNQFVTQRENAKLALLEPHIKNGTLTLTAPGQAPLSIETHSATQRRPVQIWRDTVEALDQGEAAAQWLSDYLGETVRLVKFDEAVVRNVSAQYARRPTDQTGFADGYPLLIISQESLDDLNARLATPLPMNRFRPNLVVSGATPYAEDTWKQIRIGAVVLDIVKPCARCMITTTDQNTAVRGKEPLATLATYRDSERGVLFGQNVIHAAPGMLQLGQIVEVLE